MMQRWGQVTTAARARPPSRAARNCSRCAPQVDAIHVCAGRAGLHPRAGARHARARRPRPGADAETLPHLRRLAARLARARPGRPRARLAARRRTTSRRRSCRSSPPTSCATASASPTRPRPRRSRADKIVAPGRRDARRCRRSRHELDRTRSRESPIASHCPAHAPTAHRSPAMTSRVPDAAANATSRTASRLALLRQLEWRVRHAVENVLSGEYRSTFRGRGMEFDQVVQVRVRRRRARHRLERHRAPRRALPQEVRRGARGHPAARLRGFAVAAVRLRRRSRNARRCSNSPGLVMLLGAVNRDRVGFVHATPDGYLLREPVRGRGQIMHAAATLLGRPAPDLDADADSDRLQRSPGASSPSAAPQAQRADLARRFPPPRPRRARGLDRAAAPLPDDGLPRRRSRGSARCPRGETFAAYDPDSRPARHPRGHRRRARRPRRLARAARGRLAGALSRSAQPARRRHRPEPPRRAGALLPRPRMQQTADHADSHAHYGARSLRRGSGFGLGIPRADPALAARAAGAAADRAGCAAAAACPCCWCPSPPPGIGLRSSAPPAGPLVAGLHRPRAAHRRARPPAARRGQARGPHPRATTSCSRSTSPARCCAEDYEKDGERINRLQAIKPVIQAFIERPPQRPHRHRRLLRPRLHAGAAHLRPRLARAPDRAPAASA